MRKLETMLTDIDQNIFRIQYSAGGMLETSKIIGFNNKILLFISKLKGIQVKEMSKRFVPEKEPYTGPLPLLLRVGVHKPYPENL